MANYRLYLDKPCEGVLGRSTKYWYNDELLAIEWRGERHYNYVPERTAVVVKCNGGQPVVEELRWPRNFRWRALWLCGVPKRMRFDRREEYEEAAEAAGSVRRLGGAGWEIAMIEVEDGKLRPTAGWMAGRVENKEIHRMVKACGVDVPAWFTKKVLGFGF